LPQKLGAHRRAPFFADVAAEIRINSLVDAVDAMHEDRKVNLRRPVESRPTATGWIQTSQHRDERVRGQARAGIECHGTAALNDDLPRLR
jgi:hypothetical protein